MSARLPKALFCIALYLAAISGARAQDAVSQKEAMAIMVIPEIVLMTLASLNDRFQDDVREIGWTAQYSDEAWSFRIENAYGAKNRIDLSVNSKLSNADGGGFLHSYSGSATLGEEPIKIDGQINWRLSETSQKLETIAIRYESKIGENSRWVSMKAGEIVGCGGVAAGLYSLTIPATGGFSLGLAAQFLGVAARAGSACVSLSRIVQEFRDQKPEELAPPSPPTFPEKEGEEIDINDEVIIIAESNGRISGRIPQNEKGGNYILYGDILRDGKYMKGMAMLEEKR